MKPSELIKWRKKNRFTQKELADLLGVAEVTVFRWEKAMRKIPPFLHLALKWLELRGGETKTKGKKIKKERR
jgi:transcriptional regulator with XRE-family HTH domain